MLCYQLSQVWVHYVVSGNFRGLSMESILLDVTEIQEVIQEDIPGQRTTLALERDQIMQIESENRCYHVKKLTVY